MSTKASPKINLFLPVFLVVVVALAALTIITFRSIFSNFISIYEVETNLDDAKLRIDTAKLDQAIKAVYEKEQVKLIIE